MTGRFGFGEDAPVFVFMLTRRDLTIADAPDRLRDALTAGIRHVGFKDVGLPLDELAALAEAIRAGGARVYLEIVSLDAASEAASARAAVALGADVLMGGTRPQVVLPLIAGSPIRYFPYAGRVTGHPGVLEGSADEIVADAVRTATSDGVAGLSLLAFRSAGDAPALMARVCAAVLKPVIMAGSIDRPARIDDVVRNGAAGFTVGTAALDGRFPAHEPGLPAQLRAIRTSLDGARERWPASARP